MIAKSIYSILANNAAVTALVGTRISPNRVILATELPFLVYSIIDVQPTNTKDGVSKLDVIYFDINVITDNQDNKGFFLLEDLSAKVRTALDRYSGTVETNKIQSIYYIDEKDEFSEEAKIHFRTISFKLRLEI